METALPQPYLPNHLTIITTNSCTAQCSHCVMCSAPGRREMLTFAQIQRAVESFCDFAPLELVVFTGGEPTLLGEDLWDAIAYVEECGLIARVVTNAHWADTPAHATAMVRRFRECGLSELNLSADDYHAQYIPLQNVKNAWQAAHDMGFQDVVIANSHGIHSRVHPAFLQEFLEEEIPVIQGDDLSPLSVPPSPDGTAYLLCDSTVQKVDRGNATISDEDVPFPEDQRMLGAACQWALRTPVLSPDNHLWACCGTHCAGNPTLDFGSLDHCDAQKLLLRASDDVVLNALMYLGPLFLRDFVQRFDSSVPFQPRYASVCEVCEDVVKNDRAQVVLRDHLGPLAQYVLSAQNAQKSAG